MRKLKVVTLVGTRPEIIRLSRLIPVLDQHTNHVLVHTGQNYDPQLSDVFFEELEIRTPDYYLGVDTTSFGTVMGDTLKKSEEVFRKEKPDAVMILGDTNSALAAIVAERMHIPVYHMEAGNRSFDRNVPEELNRKLVDHVSTFNLVYSEHARRNLLREGLGERFIYLTGSPMPEILGHYSAKASTSQVLQGLGISPSSYLLLSLHRQENVDDIERLDAMLHKVNEFAKRSDLRVVFSVHPRTATQVRNQASLEQFIFSKPFGFIDYLSLQKDAYCVISDSGSLPEEALVLGFPAVIFRNSMERPEALEAGQLVMAATDIQDIEPLIRRARESNIGRVNPVYPDLGFSGLVMSLLESTARLANSWTGVTQK